jgi:soluble lytic murein transglycosylase
MESSHRLRLRPNLLTGRRRRMQAIGRAVSRLPAAWAMIAGVAMLAGMSGQRTLAQTQQTQNGTGDTAFAVPRVAPHGLSGVALPQPLAPSDAARLRRIFTAQARGKIPEALRDTEALDTTDLLLADVLGHVLADRYLGPGTRPNATELRGWLDAWGRQPDAPAIHALLLSRLPRGSARPPAPTIKRLAGTTADDGADAGGTPVPEEGEPSGQTFGRRPALDAAVRNAARTGPPGAVARLIARAPGLPALYAAQLKGEAAQMLFALNRDGEAYEIGASGAGCDTASPDCGSAALPGFRAGLAAWRMDRMDLARPMFEAAWSSDHTTASLHAAAAFWASRVHQRQRDDARALVWMQRAAGDGHSFYGLLARRSLGLSLSRPDSGRGMLAQADMDAVGTTPEGLRAFALLQIGQAARAEAELRLLWPTARGNPALGRAIMLVAERAELVDLAAQLADLMQAVDGSPRAATRFPIPRLKPAGGFIVDPALVYALARTESNFDPMVVSPAGARGLMQIMPDTARFIGGDEDAARQSLLHDPAVNLDLGQRYVAHLATLDVVGGDMIRLLASYNAGPGNLGRWSQTIRDDGDPLMFIEAIPIDETRAFIPRVLTYSWIYAGRLRRPTTSLTELAGGSWPRFAPMSTGKTAPIH